MSDINVESAMPDLKRIANLLQGELRDWVRARLLGQDVESFGDTRQGTSPHYVVASAYPLLDRDSRSYMRQIVVDFLWQMARDEQSCWQGEPAHSLLMLAQMMDEPEFIEPIQEMAEEQHYVAPVAADSVDDLHHRLLQSLVMLGWRGTPEFWHEQFALAPVRYANVAFAGLAQVALQHAIDLLPEMDWENEDVQDQMEIALRGLLPEHRRDEIGKAITRIIPQLTASAITFIKESLPEVQPFIENYPQPEQAMSLRVNIPEAKEVLRESGQKIEARSLMFAAASNEYIN